MELKLKSNKGITLIALVITIIILSILAGVSITAVKGDKGIIKKAKEAETETRGMSVEEARDLWEVHNEEVAVPKSLNTLLDELITKKLLTQQEKQEILNSTPHQITIGSKTIIFTEPPNNEGGKPVPPSPPTPTPPPVPTPPPPPTPTVTPGIIITGENKMYTKNGTAVIPKGFAIVPGLDDVSQGLVISDVANDTNNQGNQFVWIPVTDMSKFVRQEGYFNGDLDFILLDCGEANAKGINIKVTESAETQIEAKAMYKSVQNNKGFYIGRYETSRGASGNAEVKKNRSVWTSIKWGDSMVNKGTTGAVAKARAMYTDKNTYGVASTLCYGVQWDAALRFIDPDYTGYARDSSKQGWYKDNYNNDNTGANNTNPTHQTGIDLIYKNDNGNIANKKNNIYDMAGNVGEWTMESHNTSSRVERGGYYYDSGSRCPSSGRFCPDPTLSDDSVGFRVTLYV